MAEYPLSKFHFQVDWGSEHRVGFTEVSGLAVETELIEYREGSSLEFSKVKMPGMQKYGNITLKRGVFHQDNDFYDWWNSVQLNIIERRTVTISMLNSDHEALVTWTVNNAWPVKVDHGDLKADGNEVSIETLELAHEGITVKHA